MSTNETIKHQHETGVGGFHLYRECLDKDYVYLTLDGAPFKAANTAAIDGEDGLSSIAFRLPAEWARKLRLIGNAQEAVPGSDNVSANMKKMSREREEDVRRGAAMNAHYGLDLLARSLPMPKWPRYVVRCADDCQPVTVVLVTKRKNPQWPNWDEIAPLISCERNSRGRGSGHTLPPTDASLLRRSDP